MKRLEEGEETERKGEKRKEKERKEKSCQGACFLWAASKYMAA